VFSYSQDVELAGDYMSVGGYSRVRELWRKAALFESFTSAFDEPESLYQVFLFLFYFFILGYLLLPLMSLTASIRFSYFIFVFLF